MDTTTHLESPNRPTGFVQPEHERAARALQALRDRRLPDAAAHAEAIPDASATDRSWRLITHGLVATERGEISRAEPLLLEACVVSVTDALRSDNPDNTDMWRLAARTMHHLGWVYRRQDRLHEATRTHLAAHRLRNDHGSFEELWETAVELGLDFDVARDHETAQAWFREALSIATHSALEPHRLQAAAWTHLSTSCAASGRHEQAVCAARSARDAWRAHDIGAVTAARGDLTLGTALFRYGQSLYDGGNDLNRSVLHEAVEWLATAQQALLAFGETCAGEAHLAGQQCDFARRLLASPPIESSTRP